MKKLAFFFVLIVALLITAPVLAENWQNEGYQREPALKGDVYEIYTPEELAWVAKEVNSGNTFSGKTVKLMDDIDLSGREWTPVGGWDGTKFDIEKYFSGTFDGNNKTIYNLQIGTSENPNNTYKYVGLFGYLYEGKIKDLSVKNVNIYMLKILIVTQGEFVGTQVHIVLKTAM